MIIIHRIMERASVVPYRQIAGLPDMTALEFLSDLMGEQIIQQPFAFCDGPAVKMTGMCHVDKQGFSAGFRVGADNRMNADQLIFIALASAFCDPVCPCRGDRRLV